MPESSVINAMRQATFTEEDIANVHLRRFLQRALPGGSIKGFKAYIAGLLLPQPCHDRGPTRLVDDAIVNNVEANIVHVEECTTPVTVNSVVNVEPMTAKAVAKRKAVKRKARNMWFYKNKKSRVHSSSPAAITTTTTTTTTTMTTTTRMTMAAIASTLSKQSR